MRPKSVPPSRKGAKVEVRGPSPPSELVKMRRCLKQKPEMDDPADLEQKIVRELLEKSPKDFYRRKDAMERVHQERMDEAVRLRAELKDRRAKEKAVEKKDKIAVESAPDVGADKAAEVMEGLLREWGKIA